MKKNKNSITAIKIKESEILQILLDHFVESKEFHPSKLRATRINIFGEVGKDLRAVCVFSDTNNLNIHDIDLDNVDIFLEEKTDIQELNQLT